MRIAVVGYSCSGKTTLTQRLAELYPDHKVYHTDEYQSVASYAEAPHIILASLTKENNPNIIVEGIHTYRILRRGAESRSLFFDLVINCQTTPEKRYERYRTQRNAEGVGRQPAVEKSLDKIFNNYLGLCNLSGNTPKIIDYWS